MRISNLRRAGATAYRHLHNGLSTASAVVEKSAHIYSLVQPSYSTWRITATSMRR